MYVELVALSSATSRPCTRDLWKGQLCSPRHLPAISVIVDQTLSGQLILGQSVYQLASGKSKCLFQRLSGLNQPQDAKQIVLQDRTQSHRGYSWERQNSQQRVLVHLEASPRGQRWPSPKERWTEYLLFFSDVFPDSQEAQCFCLFSEASVFQNMPFPYLN